MSEDETTGSQTGTAPPKPGVRHRYPLATRDYGLAAAIGLLIQSLPYALARFGILLAYSVACMVWIVVTFGGAALLANYVAGIFGFIWFIACLLGAGWVWGAIMRYLLHLLECGHVAVLTEFITRGKVGNGGESMLAYGRKVVTERFGQVNVLYALNGLVRGVLASFHRTLDWVVELVPLPGVEGVAGLVNVVLRAATRYLDKVILSYNLARAGDDPWEVAREGMVYYAQNAAPILKTSAWIVILERVLTALLWLFLLIPAGTITYMMPRSVHEQAGLVTVLVAALLAGPLRAAFLKPLFLIMMMVRFHALIERQPINEEWDAKLTLASNQFRDLAARGQDALAKSGFPGAGAFGR
jgi:hypothetical protein